MKTLSLFIAVVRPFLRARNSPYKTLVIAFTMADANVRTSRKILNKVTVLGGDACDKAAVACHTSKGKGPSCATVCSDCKSKWSTYEAKWSKALKTGDICRHCKAGPGCPGGDGPGPVERHAAKHGKMLAKTGQ